MTPFSPIQPADNSALLATVLTPQTSWGALMSLKDRELQGQMILTQQEQNRALEMQNADAEIQAFKATLNSVEFEEPDTNRVRKWVNKEQRELATRLKDEYQGDVRKFFLNEGKAWTASTIQRMKETPEYKLGQKNREQAGLLKDAIAKGLSPVGKVVTVKGKDHYVSAEDQYMHFRNGLTDSFTFLGSYKDDNDDLKELRETYAPGRNSWERVQVAPDAVYSHLLAKNSPEIAADKWARKYKGVSVFYKSDPAERKREFDMKRQSFNADMQLKGQQFRENQLDIDKKTRDAAAEKTGYGPNFLNSQLQNAIPGKMIDVSSAQDRKLPLSGIDLNQLSGNRGGIALSKIPLQGDTRKIIDQQFNFQEIKEKGVPKGWRANLREGFSEEKGVPLNLEGVNYKVVDKDSDIYFPQAQVGKNGIPVDQRNGLTGFARMKVQLDSDEDAEKLGLYKAPWLWTNSVTETGSNVHFNSDDRSFWMYAPMGSVAEPNFQYNWQAEQFGTNAATRNMGLGMGRKK